MKACHVLLLTIIVALLQSVYPMRLGLRQHNPLQIQNNDRLFNNNFRCLNSAMTKPLNQISATAQLSWHSARCYWSDSWNDSRKRDMCQLACDLLKSPPVQHERFLQVVSTVEDGYWTLQVINTLLEQAKKYKNWEHDYSQALGNILSLEKVDLHYCNVDPLHRRLFVPDAPVLHKATKNDLPLCIKSLIWHKAKINAVDVYTSTALHHAESQEVAQILIDRGSYISAQDCKYNTPLHTVATSLVPMLLKHGADPSMQCCDIFTIIDSDQHQDYDKQLWELQFEDQENIKNVPCGHYDHATALVCSWHTPIMQAIINGDKERSQTLLALSSRDVNLKQIKTLHVLAQAQWYRSNCKNYAYEEIRRMLKEFEKQ